MNLSPGSISVCMKGFQLVVSKRATNVPCQFNRICKSGICAGAILFVWQFAVSKVSKENKNRFLFMSCLISIVMIIGFNTTVGSCPLNEAFVTYFSHRLIGVHLHEPVWVSIQLELFFRISLKADEVRNESLSFYFSDYTLLSGS